MHYCSDADSTLVFKFSLEAAMEEVFIKVISEIFLE